MTPRHWTLNLKSSIRAIPNHQIIETVFSSILDVTLSNDWKGACHESCGAIHILLNEFGVQNTWCIGEAKVGQAFFDHSWIEINSEIYDISICTPLQLTFRSGPIIKGIDIDTNQQTTALHGVVSGQPNDPITVAVKSYNLTTYLTNSPIHPKLGTWVLIDQVAKHKLRTILNLPQLMIKYKGQFFTQKP